MAFSRIGYGELIVPIKGPPFCRFIHLHSLFNCLLMLTNKLIIIESKVTIISPIDISIPSI